jgi:hypothetical protein
MTGGGGGVEGNEKEARPSSPHETAHVRLNQGLGSVPSAGARSSPTDTLDLSGEGRRRRAHGSVSTCPHAFRTVPAGVCFS